MKFHFFLMKPFFWYRQNQRNYWMLSGFAKIKTELELFWSEFLQKKIHLTPKETKASINPRQKRKVLYFKAYVYTRWAINVSVKDIPNSLEAVLDYPTFWKSLLWVFWTIKVGFSLMCLSWYIRNHLKSRQTRENLIFYKFLFGILKCDHNSDIWFKKLS